MDCCWEEIALSHPAPRDSKVQTELHLSRVGVTYKVILCSIHLVVTSAVRLSRLSESLACGIRQAWFQILLQSLSDNLTRLVAWFPSAPVSPSIKWVFKVLP